MLQNLYKEESFFFFLLKHVFSHGPIFINKEKTWRANGLDTCLLSGRKMEF